MRLRQRGCGHRGWAEPEQGKRAVHIGSESLDFLMLFRSNESEWVLFFSFHVLSCFVNQLGP